MMGYYNNKNYQDDKLYCDGCGKDFTEEEINNNWFLLDTYDTMDGPEYDFYCPKCWVYNNEGNTAICGYCDETITDPICKNCILEDLGE